MNTCLSVLSPLLLLLLASSTYKQVCVVRALSGAAALALARSRCDAVAKSVNAVVASRSVGVGAAHLTPRWWCWLTVAVGVAAMQCVAILVSAHSANVGGCALHVPRRRPLVDPKFASDVRRLHDSVRRAQQ
jgi:hypothetical protein